VILQAWPAKKQTAREPLAPAPPPDFLFGEAPYGLSANRVHQHGLAVQFAREARMPICFSPQRHGGTEKTTEQGLCLLFSSVPLWLCGEWN